MGRRKIEITPITHERNRAVTFLKRKNGLFKKAYELGVLCSVDVAVIIFEERAGHHVKLHEYCSTDIESMVQRHLHFDGERETKRPADFSKASGDADGHDDDDDDDGTGAGTTTSSRPGASGLGSRTSGSGGSHSSGATQQRGGSGSGSGLQRPLIGGRMGSLSSIDQLDYRSLSLPNVSHSISSSSHLYPLTSPSHSAHPPHPSLSTHLSHLNSSTNSLSTSYGGGTGSGTSLPVSLERGSQFFLPQNKRPRLDSTSSGSGGQGPYPGGPSAYTIDDPSAHAAYMGHTSQSQSQSSSNPNLYGFTRPSSSSTSARGGSGGNNSSPGSSSSPQHTQHPEHGGQPFDIDWPVHNSGSTSSNTQQAQTRITSGESGGGGNSTGWLDFLSNAPASGTGVGASPVGASAPSAPMPPDGGRTPSAAGSLGLKRARSSSSAGGTRVKEEDSDVSGRAGSVASVHSHSHSTGGNGITKTSVINDLAEIFGTGITGGGKVSDIRTDMNWTSTRTAIDVGGWYP